MKGDKLTIKQERFVKKTVETLNPAEAARQVYDVATTETARAIASQNLTKLNIREALLREFEKKDLNNDLVSDKHKENIVQGKNLPARNTALDMFYKITGAYAPEERRETRLNININDLEAVEARIGQLNDEARSFTTQSRDTEGA